MRYVLILLCFSFSVYADSYDDGYDDGYSRGTEWGDSDDYLDGYQDGGFSRDSSDQYRDNDDEQNESGNVHYEININGLDDY